MRRERSLEEIRAGLSPLHQWCIGNLLEAAADKLAESNPWCMSIEVTAWHLYWAQTSTEHHDPGDEDRSFGVSDGFTWRP